MDSAWEAINGPLQPQSWQPPKKKNKQMNKSKTWDRVLPSAGRRSSKQAAPHHHVQVRRLDSKEVIPSSPKWRELKKALTFNDAVSGCIRADLIRGNPNQRDKFNKQIEEFIMAGLSSSNKNHNDGDDDDRDRGGKMMRLRITRLRKQESYKRFSDMIRGKLSRL